MKRSFFYLLIPVLCLLSCGGDSDEPAPPAEEQGELVELKYRGSWSDNLGGSPQVSFSVQGRNGDMSGQFFWRSNFEPCCGAATLMSFTINGDDIEDLKIDERAVACGGGIPGNAPLFTGSGVIKSDGKWSLFVSADDCAGFREAIIELVKVD